jgi:hypothetical protein
MARKNTKKPSAKQLAARANFLKMVKGQRKRGTKKKGK